MLLIKKMLADSVGQILALEKERFRKDLILGHIEPLIFLRQKSSLSANRIHFNNFMLIIESLT